MLSEILDTGTVKTGAGEVLPLNSAIDRQEGEFIARLIRERGFSQSLEIGCAYGISSLFICDALAVNPNWSHTIIDPNQQSEWLGVGIANLLRADMLQFTLIEEPSELALPKLLGKGFRCDFAFIDGWHTFDHALLDFFYVNRLLSVGGVVVLDDVDYPSIAKLARFICRLPGYRVVGHVGSVQEMSLRRKLLKGVLSSVAGLTPRRLSSNVFRPEVCSTSESLGIAGTMVAFEKVLEDSRSYNWFEEF